MQPITASSHLRHIRGHITKPLLTAVPILAFMLPVQGWAQTALNTASVSAPVQGQISVAALTLRKHGKDGSFVLTVTNNGPDAVTGAVVTDKIGSGRLCPPENAVIFAGSGTPAGGFTLAALISPGITLGTLNSGQSASLTYSCQAI
ncbi:MAG: DUF11 domain-containing protein [Sphingomonadales bacterium]|jgi:uncharacterized repeat protein (TIGR01451 family)|nr:DUF11 domain-containing protein [Sphingomonadales bacterium]